MQRTDFTSSDWWLRQTGLDESTSKMRLELGAAYGWPEQDWFTVEQHLGDLFDFVQNNRGQLTTDLDNLNSEQDRQDWMASAAELKVPKQVATTQSTTTESSEEVTQAKPNDVVAPTSTEQPKKTGGLFGKSSDKSSSKMKAIDRARNSLNECTAVEKILFEGALDMTSIDAAVKQIYTNMHNQTGWEYVAGANTSAQNLLDGTANQGMCASYRNAFNLALGVFDTLRKAVGTESLQAGELKIESDDSLQGAHFVTPPGMVLMGGLLGNVYMEIDGKGAIQARGDELINKFVFTYHWSSRVNGVYYDPIFETNQKPAITTLTMKKVDPSGGRYIANTKRHSERNEFNATYIYVSEWAAFEKTVADMRKLYDENKKEIDDILSGKLKLQTSKTPKTDRAVWTTAKQLVQTKVSNVTIFERTVQETNDTAFADKPTSADAVSKIIALGLKTPA